MRLAQLRHQMLIAMGLPACWTQATAPEPAAPPVAPIVMPPPPREHEPAMFDAAACAVDQIVETVCGRARGEYCTPTAASVELTSSGDLYVTPYEQARAQARDFILDDAASEALVTRLQATNEPLEGRPACCYSRCTPLVVGVAAPLAPPPAHHVKREHCVPTP